MILFVFFDTIGYSWRVSKYSSLRYLRKHATRLHLGYFPVLIFNHLIRCLVTMRIVNPPIHPSFQTYFMIISYLFILFTFLRFPSRYLPSQELSYYNTIRFKTINQSQMVQSNPNQNQQNEDNQNSTSKKQNENSAGTPQKA